MCGVVSAEQLGHANTPDLSHVDSVSTARELLRGYMDAIPELAGYRSARLRAS